jgi:peptidoglycan/LPS O-acetylase OafA/YrhL
VEFNLRELFRDGQALIDPLTAACDLRAWQEAGAVSLDAPKFRADINALRCLAVSLVVAFHYGIPGFQYGFIGVDVFFVISGYLMTRILVKRADEDRLSIWSFYYDRATRIIPALAVIVAALIVYGAFAMPPREYLVLGKDAASSLLFLSNLAFWKDTNYFDTVAAERWLLHTWSLSVEWQFYLIYPVIFAIWYRFRRLGAIWMWLVAIGAVSLALSAWSVSKDPTFGFYLLPARAWELVAGGLIVFTDKVPPARLCNWLLACFGAALLAWALVNGAPGQAWPGYAAVLPVLGVALIIWSAASFDAIYRNPAVSLIGKASYSIYLWHWPILVWGRPYFGELTAVQTALLVAASILVGIASFRWIEMPAQRWLRSSAGFRPRILAASIVAFICLVGVGIWHARGFPNRFDPSVQRADAEVDDRNHNIGACFAEAGSPLPPCRIGVATAPVGAELIGDSHAAALAAGISAAAQTQGSAIMLSAYAACPTVAGVAMSGQREGCGKFVSDTLARLVHAGPPVIIANFWEGHMKGGAVRFRALGGGLLPFEAGAYQREFTRTVCAISAARPVFLVGPLPVFSRSVPNTVARSLIKGQTSSGVSVPLERVQDQASDARALLQHVEAACHARIIDPLPLLCAGGTCAMSKAGVPLFADANHISEFGSRQLAPLFDPIFDGGYERHYSGDAPVELKQAAATSGH